MKDENKRIAYEAEICGSLLESYRKQYGFHFPSL